MPSLLFVCHANIARSVSAELLARQRIGDDATWRVSSAGVKGLPGHPVDDELAIALQRRGVDPTTHRARQVDHTLLERADLILAFEARQRSWILQESPTLVRATFTVRRAARVLQRLPRRADARSFLAIDSAPYTERDDFDDPHGKGPAAAEAAVGQIEQLLDVILPAIGAIARAVPARDTLGRPSSSPEVRS